MLTSIVNSSAPGARAMRAHTKRWNVLNTLLERGDRGLTCFEAVAVCHDYVLRSTVSEIQQLYGVRIDRKSISVPNFVGGKSECSLYWLAPDQREIAAAILGVDPAEVQPTLPKHDYPIQ